MDVAVVGSGPNGLAAAVVFARAGLGVEVFEDADVVGGGARTAELTLPGFAHDVCSGAHPMALASPFLRAFDLAGHGVEMLNPPAAYAQPLDGGRAGIAWRDLDRTVDELGRDGAAWRRLLGPLVERWPDVVDLTMSDWRTPRIAPAAAIRFGLATAGFGWAPGAVFREDAAPAMLAGIGAHGILPPRGLAPAGLALMLAVLGHAVGWPVPRGGSQAITDALVADLCAHGGRVHTGRRIDDLAELAAERPRAVVLDVSPAGLLRLAGDRLPAAYRRRLRGYRYAGGACKVDFALSGPVPWKAEGLDQAGTLHVVGTREEAIRAEAEAAAGRHPERPYVLAIQPGVVDPTRAPEGRHTLYTYTHVPLGSPRDVSEAVIGQIERFAPGFRDLILARHVITARGQAEHNANYVGGDIGTGAVTLWQAVARPTPTWDPYATPVKGLYLCSAATPPGPGVHGLGGLNAAKRVLRQRFGITRDPLGLLG